MIIWKEEKKSQDIHKWYYIFPDLFSMLSLKKFPYKQTPTSKYEKLQGWNKLENV